MEVEIPKKISVQGIKQLVTKTADEYLLDLETYGTNSDNIDYRYLSAEQAEEIKHYLLFLRNCMIEYVKAEVQLTDEVIDAAQFDAYIETLESSMTNAKRDLELSRSAGLQTLADSGLPEGYMNQKKVYHNPIEIYRSQFALIKSQAQEILSQRQKIRSIQNQFSFIKKKLINQLEELITSIEDRKQLKDNGLMALEDMKEIEIDIAAKEKIVANAIEKLYLPSSWVDDLKTFFSNLPNEELIVGHREGNVVTRSLPLNNLLSRWLTGEILPEHKILQNMLRSSYGYYHSSYRSVLTKMKLINEDNQTALMQEVKASIEKTVRHEDGSTKGLQQGVDKLRSEIENTLKLSTLFSDEKWLDISMQNAYSHHFKEGSGGILDYLIAKQQQIKVQFNAWRESTLSTNFNLNEQLIDFNQHKLIDEQLDTYADIFLDETGQSEYYLINRERHLDRIKEEKVKWENGFGTSTLITGTFRCGKSTFISQVSKHYWPKMSIYLKPDSLMTLEGRKFKTSFDIDDALEEILKSIHAESKYCLIIEDLESWRDSEYSVQHTIQVLIRFFNKHRPNIFSICSFNSHFLHASNACYDLLDYFTCVIDLSKATSSQFTDTLKIRNLANQKDLYGRDAKLLSDWSIGRSAKKILSNNHGNIGSALLDWVSNIEVKEDKLVFSEKRLKVPKFLQDQYLFILKHVLIYKKSKQQDLVKLRSNISPEETRNLIGKLLRLKVLIRNEDRTVSIAPILSGIINAQFEASGVGHKLNHYELRVVESQEPFENIQAIILPHMFHYPFRSPLSDMKITKQKDSVSLIIKSLESPSEVLKYLNRNTSELVFQFHQKYSEQ